MIARGINPLNKRNIVMMFSNFKSSSVLAVVIKERRNTNQVDISIDGQIER